MRTCLFCLPILLLLFAGPARAETAVARVTLQVRNEPGYTAADVACFLADPAYLGSVYAGMVPAASYSADVFPGDVLVLTVATPGKEILTLELRGAQQGVVTAGMEGLLAHLKSIVPANRLEARVLLDAARQEHEQANEAYSKAHAALRSFTEQHVALDPDARLAQVRGSLMDLTVASQSLDLELAGQRALRDYLVEAIAREPGEIMVGPSEPRISQLERMLEVSRAELAALEADRPEASEEIAFTKESIRQREEQLAEARAALSHPNPRRAGLEDELFSVERELVLAESRRACLAERVAKETEESTQLALLAREHQELQEALAAAEARLHRARASLDQLFRPQYMGEWLQVLAGPRVTSELAEH